MKYKLAKRVTVIQDLKNYSKILNSVCTILLKTLVADIKWLTLIKLFILILLQMHLLKRWSISTNCEILQFTTATLFPHINDLIR